MLIEDWEVADAFYMTIITVTTVGFREVHELSTSGQLFTTILIVTTFGVFTYALTLITNYLVGGAYKKDLKEITLKKTLDKLEDHVIICGLGRVGMQVAEKLTMHDQPYIIIDRDSSIYDEFKDAAVIHGDATQDHNLEIAQITKAKALITSLPQDADNLFVVLSARSLNPKLQIISRASIFSSIKKLKIAGADNVIMPDSVGGSHMASLIATPNLVEFLDYVSIQGEGDVSLEEVVFECPKGESFMINDLMVKKSGCNLIGIRDEFGEYIINPSEELPVSNEARLFVLGTKSQIHELKSLINLEVNV